MRFIRRGWLLAALLGLIGAVGAPAQDLTLQVEDRDASLFGKASQGLVELPGPFELRLERRERVEDGNCPAVQDQVRVELGRQLARENPIRGDIVVPVGAAKQPIATSQFTLDLNLTDGQSHQVALYMADWDTTARAQTVTVTDAATGSVLDTRGVSNFHNGQWLVWNLSGHVKITLTCTAGFNAVAQGLMIGGGGTVVQPPPASGFVKSDTTTQGSWGGVYGHTWFIDPARALTVLAMTNTSLEGLFGPLPDEVRDAVCR